MVAVNYCGHAFIIQELYCTFLENKQPLNQNHTDVKKSKFL